MPVLMFALARMARNLILTSVLICTVEAGYKKLFNVKTQQMKNILIVGIILLFAACSTGEKAAIYWVNSYRVDCVGVGPMKCMLVQKGETPEPGKWTNFYSKIEGFEYEPGFIYKLKVKEEQLENVPADASSIKYTLVEVLEKKEDIKLALDGSWEALKINGSVIKLPRSRGAGVYQICRLIFATCKLVVLITATILPGKLMELVIIPLSWGPLPAHRKCALT